MLTVNQLSFERHFQPVFQPVDFQLGPGELLVLTGENGSGKTTLLRLLAGILTASDGHIQSEWQSRSYLGHHLAIKDDLTVAENLRFMRDFSENATGNGHHSIQSLTQILGLSAEVDQLTRTLSAGQRKRCALGRLMLTSSDLWLLDEPYSNLDQTGIRLVDQLVESHCDTGGCCIMATHGGHRPATGQLIEIELKSGGNRV